MKPMYTAVATATGGRDGRARSEDGALDVALAMPKQMGGSGAGVNPEQLFAAGYAACFQSAMMFIASQQKLDASESTVIGSVTIGARDDGPGFGLAVHHRVSLPNLSQGEAQALVDAAHAVCPYSNATRNNIPVEFEIHAGRPS